MDTAPFTFELPPALNAVAPPERRGLRRDHVRLMALDRHTGAIEHARFFDLPRFLRPGDLLVMNASRTLPAELRGIWSRREAESAGQPTGTQGQPLEALGQPVEIRLARRRTDHIWEALVMADGLQEGDRIRFGEDFVAEIVGRVPESPLVQLHFSLGGSRLEEQIYQLGQPIRYEYITVPWGLDYYQTIFASEPGSVEMPSAGRPFSWELLFRLQKRGIRTAFLQLHTGLSYWPGQTEQQNPAQNWEQYHIPEATAEAVLQARQAGGRVVAVGTTVVRALETAFAAGVSRPKLSGWTNMYIDGRHRLQAADGLISGFHEPKASHLALLSAFIDTAFLRDAYEEAVQAGYLWHEFGDMTLIC